MFHPCQLHQKLKKQASNSATGTRTRVARVRAEYPDQLDYSGAVIQFPTVPIMQTKHVSHTADRWSPYGTAHTHIHMQACKCIS